MLKFLQAVILIDRIDGSAGLHLTDRLDDSIIQTISPAMKVRSLLISPCALDRGSLCKIKHLLLHIQFHKPVFSLLHIADCVQLCTMNAIYILDVSQPHVEYSLVIYVGHRCLNATAAIMPANNNMLYLEMVHREVEHAKQVHIIIDNKVRHISVHEYLTRLCSCDLVCRDSAVAASNP